MAFYGSVDHHEDPLIAIDVLPEEMAILTPQEIADNYQTTRNVVASRRSKYSSRVTNFGKKSEARMQDQIDADLANLEAQVIQELREKGIGPKESEVVEKKNFDNVDTYETGEETSYSNAVVTYDLGQRTHRKLPKPAYKCKNAGTVVIRIVVDDGGSMKSVELDPSLSSNDECLIEEALASAQKSLFSSDLDQKKQEGTITYTFLRQ